MSDVALEMNCAIKRHPDLLAVPMDGDLVMMSISQGSYFGINPVGARIWEVLQTPKSLDELCGMVTTEFDVETEQCRRDLLIFVKQMLDAQVVQLA